jgi:hypothetical protein
MREELNGKTTSRSSSNNPRDPRDLDVIETPPVIKHHQTWQ